MKNSLTPNFTQIPNIILDEYLSKLSHAETKVLLYLCRRTYGFHKQSDYISISQICGGITTDDGTILDTGTGLSNKPVIRALKTLEDIGLITSKRSQGNTTKYTMNSSYVESTPVDLLHGTSGLSTQVPMDLLHTQKKEKESIQNKDTHPEKNSDYLLNIPEHDIDTFRKKYKATKSEIIIKGEALHSWAGSVGKKYKDYRLFLMNALLRDYGLRELDTPGVRL